MLKIQLIHWNSDELEERAEFLRQAGYSVDTSIPNGPPFLRKLSENLPDAVVIDLSRLPSHSREVAVSIRMRKATRQIPLVFIGGEIEKIERVRNLLPDATFSEWSNIFVILDEINKKNIIEPVIVPTSAFDAYSGTPLVKKLGIKAGAKVGLIAEPDNFLASLGELPLGVTVIRDHWQDCELILWFVRSREDLVSNFPSILEKLTRGSIWIAWQKKASNQGEDLTQQEVRELGLSYNLVDYKICSIDEIWSALLFTRRK